jgi:hypothetical protein
LLLAANVEDIGRVGDIDRRREEVIMMIVMMAALEMMTKPDGRAAEMGGEREREREREKREKRKARNVGERRKEGKEGRQEKQKVIAHVQFEADLGHS